ncbi:DUF1559 domain-containing protein [Planctomicrobium sp. SH668]|uniref:DUF1559 family PulG-like putative transporter n=1 Tax=Planctomicrobium sp. SH668 TaxID=3448126 RepID=UPI003F5BE8DE
MKINRRVAANRHGFTLIELMVVIGIIGVLASLLMPAVQQARESARRTQCKNNLHQIGVALHSFTGTKQQFPEGADFANFLNHSWCTRLLPYLEQSVLYNKYDWNLAWDNQELNSNGVTNSSVTQTKIPSLICPSSTKDRPGGTDYGGCYGTSRTGMKAGYGSDEGWTAGLLVPINAKSPNPRKSPVALGEVPDGLSNTFLVLECIGKTPPYASWGDGTNCLPMETAINAPTDLTSEAFYSSIYSLHPQGGNALFGDGRVAFLSESIDLQILAGLATRAGSEVVSSDF